MLLKEGSEHVFPGVLTYLISQMKPQLLAQYWANVQPVWSPQDPGTMDHLGTGSFLFPSVPWS